MAIRRLVGVRYCFDRYFFPETISSLPVIASKSTAPLAPFRGKRHLTCHREERFCDEAIPPFAAGDCFAPAGLAVTDDVISRSAGGTCPEAHRKTPVLRYPEGKRSPLPPLETALLTLTVTDYVIPAY
jgi:hypothetical protein